MKACAKLLGGIVIALGISGLVPMGIVALVAACCFVMFAMLIYAGCRLAGWRPWDGR